MKRILVVEDDPDIQEMLCAYLHDAGYETGAAGDGIAALDLFHGGTWNLVLLNVLLPKVDGYGVCGAYPSRVQHPNHHAYRLGCGGNQLKGFDLSIDDYVTKSISPYQSLLRKIAAVLPPCRQRGRGDQPTGLPGDDPRPRCLPRSQGAGAHRS